MAIDVVVTIDEGDRRAEVLRIAAGPSEVHRLLIAETVVGEYEHHAPVASGVDGGHGAPQSASSSTGRRRWQKVRQTRG